MDIRKLTDDFSVAPQVMPDELQALSDAGFKTVICNRPDAEVEPQICIAEMKRAAQAAGLNWHENTIQTGGMTMDNVLEQGRLAAESDGPVLAYCRSGTRSATAWAFAQAGKIPTDEIIAITAKGGYDLSPMRGQIDALAQQG